MTYARARLLLGIFGVGSIVTVSAVLLGSQSPLQMLPTSASWSWDDLQSLLSLFGLLTVCLFPLDFLGGFLLPNRWRPNTIAFRAFLGGWLRGALVQGGLFVGIGLIVLSMGRWLGVFGAAMAVAAIAILLIAAQLPIAKFVGSLSTWLVDNSEPNQATKRDAEVVRLDSATVLSQALSLTSDWGWKQHPIAVLHNEDSGFTGGIVGLPGRETVVLPAGSLSKLSPEQLAITIARRFEAIQSGGRTRGLLLALAWVITGFTLSANLPGAGVTSVGQLAMTCLGFTLWTFIGLLTLPTLSRQAAYAIDGKILKTKVSPEAFQETLKTLDVFQDDEPSRSKLIEAIFHPVPSVDNRRVTSSSEFPIAWHAARMTLFLSWASMGMLVRVVHCNVGRPQLWVMLPTD